MIIMIMDSCSSLCSIHTTTDPPISQLTYPVDVRKLYLFIYLFTCLFIYLFLCVVVYEIQLLSTWGDQYYIGLTGIEIKDKDNKTVPLFPSSKQCLHAHSTSHNSLSLSLSLHLSSFVAFCLFLAISLSLCLPPLSLIFFLQI